MNANSPEANDPFSSFAVAAGSVPRLGMRVRRVQVKQTSDESITKRSLQQLLHCCLIDLVYCHLQAVARISCQSLCQRFFKALSSYPRAGPQCLSPFKTMPKEENRDDIIRTWALMLLLRPNPHHVENNFLTISQLSALHVLYKMLIAILKAGLRMELIIVHECSWHLFLIH